MSRVSRNSLFFGALCSSYLVLCAASVPSFAADEANGAVQVKKAPAKVAVKSAKPIVASVEDTDSWRGKSVFERSRDEYTSEGIRVGGFKFKPSVDLSETYDSNIYATQTGTKEDLITKVAPAVVLESEWSNHALAFNASGDIGSYSDNSRENYGDYAVGTSGRLDVLRETYLVGSASTSFLHEDRGSPDARTTSKNPTEYTSNNASLGLIRNLQKLSVKLTGDYNGLNYDNGNTAAGAVVVNNDRDRSEYKGTVRVGYEIIPEYEAFLKSTMNKREYDLQFDNSGIHRDSSGYEVVAGTALNLSGKTKGEIFAGYMDQNYASSALKDVGAVQFGGNILWNATGLTSVKAGIVRGVAETTNSTSSSYTSTTYSLGLEHEVTYNILAGVNTYYSTNDYNNLTATSREDEIAGAGAELRYLINRNASVVSRYDYTTRDSNVVGQDYDRSQISFGLKLAM